MDSSHCLLCCWVLPVVGPRDVFWRRVMCPLWKGFFLSGFRSCNPSFSQKTYFAKVHCKIACVNSWRNVEMKTWSDWDQINKEKPQCQSSLEICPLTILINEPLNWPKLFLLWVYNCGPKGKITTILCVKGFPGLEDGSWVICPETVPVLSGIATHLWGREWQQNDTSYQGCHWF